MIYFATEDNGTYEMVIGNESEIKEIEGISKKTLSATMASGKLVIGSRELIQIVETLKNNQITNIPSRFGRAQKLLKLDD